MRRRPAARPRGWATARASASASGVGAKTSALDPAPCSDGPNTRKSRRSAMTACSTAGVSPDTSATAPAGGNPSNSRRPRSDGHERGRVTGQRPLHHIVVRRTSLEQQPPAAFSIPYAAAPPERRAPPPVGRLGLAGRTAPGRGRGTLRTGHRPGGVQLRCPPRPARHRVRRPTHRATRSRCGATERPTRPAAAAHRDETPRSLVPRHAAQITGRSVPH